MKTLLLRHLLEEFEEWVAEGRVKRIPYEEWRHLKKHEHEQVTIARDGWNDLDIFSETNCKYLTNGWHYDDNSLGTYLNHIFIHEFDNEIYLHDPTYTYKDWGVVKSEPCPPMVEINHSGISINGENVTDKFSEIENKIDEAAGFSINRKENDSMTNLFKNFDFGSCANDNVKVSMYGIAVKNANGTWVSYDSKTESVIDVDILNFDAKYLYKMPVAIKDVAVGDTVIHNRKPMFVTKVDDGKLLVIDPAAGEEKVVLLTKSMFGFDFVTKVVNLFGNCFNTASEDQPFGNMLPLMMFADGGKENDMLPLMFAMGGGNFDMSNPMMLYFLMKDNKADNMLPLMFAMNGNLFGKHECKCEGCSR